MKRRARNDVKPWPVVSSRIVSEHRILRVREDRLRSPRTGKTNPFVVIEGSDWVNVIALTPDEKVVFIRQFRFGVRETTLEVPGGLVDPGESPADAAARELLEETGYAGSKPVLLGNIHPNPAIQDNVTWTYLVKNAKRIREPDIEDTEDIVTLTRPLSSVPRRIRTGEITHALVVVAFTHLWLRRGLTSSRRRSA